MFPQKLEEKDLIYLLKPTKSVVRRIFPYAQQKPCTDKSLNLN